MAQRLSTVMIFAAALTSGVVATASRAVNVPPSIAANDESESADARPSLMTDNPYDDSAPAPRAGVPHVSVPSQDGMLRLPGGKAVVGSANAKAPANERPARPIALSPFWIDRTEVTVGAYRACVQAGACARPSSTSPSCTYTMGDNLPVSCVRWTDAESYCRFAKKRLPTEVEWEYAARGPHAVPFPWGSSPSCSNAMTLLNERTGRSCAPHPAPVGSHPSGASVFGVEDMSGNVEEWTADWYVESPGTGPSPRSGAAHVLRGGGWLSPPSLSRTTSRDWGSALESGPNVGFRCARSE
jgi:formylglycine-generating enzyme required for sulfatase activity